jgi:hypothetical protein
MPNFFPPKALPSPGNQYRILVSESSRKVRNPVGFLVSSRFSTPSLTSLPGAACYLSQAFWIATSSRFAYAKTRFLQ